MKTPAPTAAAAATTNTSAAFPFFDPCGRPACAPSPRSPTPVENVVSRSLGLLGEPAPGLVELPVLLPVGRPGLWPSSGDEGWAPRTPNVDPPDALSAAISAPMSPKRSSGFL